jgi:hypothetical protein
MAAYITAVLIVLAGIFGILRFRRREDAVDDALTQASPVLGDEQPPDEGAAEGEDAGGVVSSAARAHESLREVLMPAVAPTQILRWVNGVSPPPVPVVPNAIPTSFRGKIEVLKRPNGSFVCQHLPHPGGKDYLLYPMEEMPLSEEELRRAQWSQTTVVVTLENGKIVAAKIPQQQSWGRGLWQQRSGWYRGGR